MFLMVSQTQSRGSGGESRITLWTLFTKEEEHLEQPIQIAQGGMCQADSTVGEKGSDP